MITLVVSDLHLGASNSLTAQISELLDSDFDRLILNGDTVDGLNFRRFGRDCWRVLDQLRAISRERELVLVRGNHDGKRDENEGFCSLDVLGRLLETDLREQYELDVGDERYLVLHGDQFDHTMNLTWIGDAADWVYRGLQRGSRQLACWIKGRVKHLGGVVRCVQEGSLAFARRHGYDGVITGHTHYGHDERIDGIHYLNTGCWVDLPCSYVRIEDDTARFMHWTGALPVRAACCTLPAIRAS